MCGKNGRRAMPKKIDQLENRPEPTNAQQLNSFLCFVNYLAEYMDPDWVKALAVLSPLRKKDADSSVWAKEKKLAGGFWLIISKPYPARMAGKSSWLRLLDAPSVSPI